MGLLWDRVFTTGNAELYEDFLYVINGDVPHEEIYVTFSYGAIRGETGAVEGLFCPCYETTAKVVGARRMETLRQLGEQAVESMTSSAVGTTASKTTQLPVWVDSRSRGHRPFDGAADLKLTYVSRNSGLRFPTYASHGRSA